MKLNNYTILYVEDDIDTQELMSNILKMTFKEVFVASNGKEGLELYKEKKPDIVLSDISMP
ncbi:MAG: response regulator, partial [Sulfurovaceae bacterium]|nr:response regulator [Sulfurovaceae bacterium]